MLTRQETFDRVTAHLAQQGCRATDGGDPSVLFCRYRTEDGLKCAIGCLIPDERYHPTMEGKVVSSKEIKKALKGIVSIHHETTISFLESLQEIHDYRNIILWPQSLRNLAKDWNLDSSAVDREFGPHDDD